LSGSSAAEEQGREEKDPWAYPSRWFVVHFVETLPLKMEVRHCAGTACTIFERERLPEVMKICYNPV
jgi:hypothetical protein